MDTRIVDMMAYMLDYQFKNSIKHECMTNVQYLYDSIKMSTNVKCKVKAVMVTNLNGDTLTFVAGHLVIELPDRIIDPSYDVFVSLKNTRYFDNIKDLLDSFDKKGRELFIEKYKRGFDKFLDFVKIADKMNSGICMVHDNIFYNAQADYVSKMIQLAKK